MSPVLLVALPVILLLLAKAASVSPAEPKPATPSIEKVADLLSTELDDEVIIVCKRGVKKP